MSDVNQQGANTLHQTEAASTNGPANPLPARQSDSPPQIYRPDDSIWPTGPPTRRTQNLTAADLAALPDDSLISQADVLTIIRISRTSWWRGVKDGRYPPAVKLGPRMNRWRLGNIRDLVRGATRWPV